MDLDVLTGLSAGQRLPLSRRCRDLLADVVRPGGRPPVLDPYRAVTLVVGLMRTNVTQECAGGIFGVGRSTVSRRWDRLRPVLQRAVASLIPAPRAVLGAGTAPVDGAIAPTWDWRHIPDLFSTTENVAGMNIRVAATLDGRLAAVGPCAVHGARHDAYAFAASGLKVALKDIHAAGDLGYVGVEGVDVIPFKRSAGCDLRDCEAEFNAAFGRIRAAIERAIAHLKSWRMLSEEAGRFRAPIHKFEEALQAIVGLMFFKTFE